MINTTQRQECESYISYIKRITELCLNKTISYSEWADGLLGDQNCYSEENCRKGFYIVNKMLNNFDENVEISEEDILKDIESRKIELLIERKKTQRINQQFHENLRYMGDHELYVEMVKEAIENLSPIKIIPTTYKKDKNETIGFLTISDAHYGKEFTIKGLFGEVVNQYSPEIYKARMWKLLSDLENDLYDVKIDRLRISDCGDAVENVLRATNSLQKLKVGVIDSALEYANFISTWLCEVYNRLKIPVEYSIVGGNHDILRLLSSKKDFDGENIAKTIHAYIEQKVEISKLKAELEYKIKPQILIREYSDITYDNLFGINILSYHGDTKNMKEDIEFFENFYQIDIDILLAGHLHRGSSETIGYGYMGDREIIRIPSIIGVDDYAKSIKKASRAGCLFMTFNEDGKQWCKTYYLN